MSLYNVGNVGVLQRPSSAGVVGAAAQVSQVMFHTLTFCIVFSSDVDYDDVICITLCTLRQKFIEINLPVNS